MLITPVVSDADLTAISFQHLIGYRAENLTRLNAMGRDAVDFATGDVLPDNTPLDGITNSLVVLQPDELVFDIVADGSSSDHEVVGIFFIDSYGPAGLLGYTASSGDVTWTSFILDFKEDPTSCENFNVGCYSNIGINESQFDQEDGSFLDALLCSGTTVPDDPVSYGDPVAWVRIFVSGLDEFENHLGYLENEDIETSRWMYTNKDENQITTVQVPTGTLSRATSQLIYFTTAIPI